MAVIVTDQKACLVRLSRVEQALGGFLLPEHPPRDLTYGEYIERLSALANVIDANRQALARLGKDFMKMSYAVESALAINSQETFDEQVNRQKWQPAYDGMRQRFLILYEMADGPTKEKFDHRLEEMNIPMLVSPDA